MFYPQAELPQFKKALKKVVATFGGAKCSNFPRCEHRLIANLKHCRSEKNSGRPFFTCPVEGPNVPCTFFQWGDSALRPEYEQYQVLEQEKEDGKEISSDDSSDDDDDGGVKQGGKAAPQKQKRKGKSRSEDTLETKPAAAKKLKRVVVVDSDDTEEMDSSE